MGWENAAIAAGAALVASAITGFVAYLTSKASLEKGTANLIKELDAERAGAREDRNQDRRKGAYVQLLKYVYRVSYVNDISHRVVGRSLDCVLEVRSHSDGQRTSELVAAERDAFVSAGPTEVEQRELDEGRLSSEDIAETRALVVAVATDDVLEAFRRLLRDDDEFSYWVAAANRAFLPDARSLAPADPTIAEASSAAKRLIDDAALSLTATDELIKAHKQYEAAAGDLVDLVRAELNDSEQRRKSAKSPHHC